MPGPCTDQSRGGRGEPLLLVHGIGATWRAWNSVLPALRERHDALAISLPGFGRSPPLEGEPSVPALADAVEAELDAAGWDDAHLVGNSLGGWIAAELARRGRARSLAMISPAGLTGTPERLRARTLTVAMHAGARLIYPVADRMMRSTAIRTLAYVPIAARGWRIPADDAAAEIRAGVDSPSFPAMLRWMSKAENVATGLDAIDCPVAVVWGTWDFLLPVRLAKRWDRELGGARVTLLPRVGHMAMTDDPEAVVAEILAVTGQHRGPDPLAPSRPAAGRPRPSHATPSGPRRG